MFKEYLGRPKETAETFDADGWFRTGDIAARDERGRYSILGRSSMDIIKVSKRHVCKIIAVFYLSVCL